MTQLLDLDIILHGIILASFKRWNHNEDCFQIQRIAISSEIEALDWARSCYSLYSDRTVLAGNCGHHNCITNCTLSHAK